MQHERKLTVKSTETRYGLMKYYEDDLFIGYALERYGQYSEDEPALWRKLIKPGSTVMDVGANIGVFTLALSDIVGDEGFVIAFEPQPQNFKLLLDNARCSRKNVRLNACALGAQHGFIDVPSLLQIENNNYGAVELGHADRTHYRRELETLDHVAANLNALDFIKIDVEGMEGEVLRGGKHTIATFRPVLYVENDREDKSATLLASLHDMAYRVFEHYPHHYSRDNFKDAEIFHENDIISLNVVCIPSERISEFADVVAGLTEVRREPPERPVVSKKGWACVVRMGGIGDNLIASSVLKLLKRDGYMVEVITSNPQACVFENNPYIDKLTIKTQREVPQNDQQAWQKYWWSRSCEYAKFVNLSHSVEVLMAQFPQSTAFYWPSEFRRQMCGKSYLEAAHDVVGVPHEFGPLFFPTMREVNDIVDFKARHKLSDKPLISWVVSGTRLDKLYPYSGLAVARMLSEMDVNVIMLSAPSPQRPDAGHTEAIMNHVQLANSSTKGLYEARQVDGRHNWPIRRLLTLARMSDLVIGPDTGVMWAVALEPVRKIMLHSHASADNITKHWLNTISLHPTAKQCPCWPCHLLHDNVESCQETQIQAGMTPSLEDKGAACIASVQVDCLVKAAKAALGDTKAMDLLRAGWASQVVLR